MNGVSFTDLYIQYAQEQTDAPEQFHRYLSYLIVSSVVSKNAYIPFGYKRLYPNLYLLIAAPSSIHRKSWSQNMAVHLIRQIHGDYLISDCSSRESFISEFSDKLRIPGECGLIKIDELKGFMDRMKNKSHYEGMLQDLASMYDNEAIKRRIGIIDSEKKTFEMHEPFLNITAACSFDWLMQSIQSSDISGGFLARFLWVVSHDSIKNPSPRPRTADRAKFGYLIEKLHKIKDFVGVIDFSEEAGQVYEKWYQGFYTENQGGLWDANYHRLAVIIQKVAMLNCLIRHEQMEIGLQGVTRLDIGRADILSAINVCVDTTHSFKTIAIGENKFEVLKKKILQFILKTGFATRSDLLNGIRGLSGKLLSDLIKTLEDADVITTVRGRNTKEERYTSNSNTAKYLR